MESSYAVRLRKSRERLGISQTELSHRVRTAQAAISNYERGVIQPGLEMRLRIAHALNDPDLRDMPDLDGVK